MNVKVDILLKPSQQEFFPDFKNLVENWSLSAEISNEIF
jgi:hypothetical protein